MQTEPATHAYLEMVDTMFAPWTSGAISAAARLGVADHLESGPKSTTELATTLNAHEDSLYRLLRALAGQGIFHEHENRTFSQTPKSDVLRTNARPSMRHVAAMLVDPWHAHSLAALTSTIENGRPSFDQLFGTTLFEYFPANPEYAVRFNRGMTDLSAGEAPAVVAAYDFSVFGHIVDIAGGAGGMLAAILESAPNLRGTLFDMPSVIEQAKADGLLSAVADRCAFESGDFFAAVPAGADAYIMKHIIHDWDEEHAGRILANCRKGINPGGKLLVVDRVIEGPNVPDPKKFYDLTMMFLNGGRERTEQEWHELFAGAGFRISRILPTPGPHSIIEGTPV